MVNHRFPLNFTRGTWIKRKPYNWIKDTYKTLGYLTPFNDIFELFELVVFFKDTRSMQNGMGYPTKDLAQSLEKPKIVFK